jgi:hypothetical protein
MRKRPALHCERLEQRELPANSFSSGILPVDVIRAAPLESHGDGLQPVGLDTQPQVQHNASWGAGLSSDAVGAFFADHTALGGLFPATIQDEADLLADDPIFESLPSPGWDSNPIHSPAKRAAPAQDAEAWSFLRKYALKAIRREEFARGPLPDHADIVQHIYVEWREGVATHDDLHARLLDRDSAERVAFRGAVRRVLDRSRYDAAKQRRRAEMTDEAETASKPSRDWADVEIDLAQGVGRLTTREREILDMRRWGATFDEIGEKFGLPRQRVFEEYSELLNRLTSIYRD